ncbi:GcrA family cell cycle regulator [Shinella sp. NM-101]|uniref:GcrA family cell cycle regulator n=1 Tax=Shinella sp. NM-101 TaxID=2744455 RepID=UPI001F383DDC|nr:GcrA family cell cycle regulator [Shinella sp. NM-101]
MTRFWTPEREQELIGLVASGKSAGTIAITLGCSRSAVVGKVSRDKARFGKLEGWNGNRRPGIVRTKSQRQVLTEGVTVPAQPPVTPPSSPPPLVPAGRPIPFLQAIDEERCLWFAGEPFGPNGPDMPVCGAPRDEAASISNRYCHHHRQMQAGPGTRAERTAPEALAKLGRAA